MTWEIIEGNCLEVLPTLTGDFDHCVSDPPYSLHVHTKAKTNKRTLPDAQEHRCRLKRNMDLGFEHLDADTRRQVAEWCGSNVKRWSMFFSDTESSHLWRSDCVDSGLQYIRTGIWVRIGGTPQITGERPAVGHEDIVICHPKGRKKWNAGGKVAVYKFPIVANRNGQRDSRVHTTQKPDELMLRLISDFTSPGDTVVDPFCGSGTTGVACVRLGRNFIGIERDPKYAAIARERLSAAERGQSLKQRRLNQQTIYMGAGK